MTEAVSGRYFYPGTSRFVPARAVVQDRNLRVEDENGAVLVHISLDHVEISPRLGNLHRRFTLLDAGCFETEDNEAADHLLQGSGKRLSAHRLERSWRWAAVAAVIAGSVVFVFVVYGIPAIALWLARETPASVASAVSQQTLQTLDAALFKPSQLPQADQKKAQALFARVASKAKAGTGNYRLLIRAAPNLGPNALALPDGTIVMTDQLWPYVKADDEIEGVFGHEIAHVERAHTLQALYQAALVPAAIAVVTGDISQVSQMAAILPGVLIQAAYSRGLEQEADDDAAVTLKRLGGNPAHLADLLQRLDAKLCGKSGCPASWLGTHPETALRIERLKKVEAK
jgi:Zn-dependent protease with chaperone function